MTSCPRLDGGGSAALAQRGDVEELARGAVGPGSVPVNRAGEPEDVDDETCEFDDGESLDGADVDDFWTAVTLGAVQECGGGVDVEELAPEVPVHHRVTVPAPVRTASPKRRMRAGNTWEC